MAKDLDYVPRVSPMLRRHTVMPKRWDYKVETEGKIPVVTDDGRVRSVPIDVVDLGVLGCDFEHMAALIDSIRSYGWQGFTDYSCELYDYGCEARARLWRRATEEEVAAHKERVRMEAEEAAEPMNRLLSVALLLAELARLKRELGEK